MISDKGIDNRVKYAKEMAIIADQLLKDEIITTEGRDAMVAKAAREGRPPETPAVPVTPAATVTPAPAAKYVLPKRTEKLKVGSLSEMVSRHPMDIPSWTGPRLPSGMPFTYDLLRDFAWRFMNSWMTDDVANVSLDAKTIGGLDILDLLYCTTSYTVSRAVPSDKTTRAGVIKRCERIQNLIERISKMRPADVIVPPEMLTTLSGSEIQLMETSREANKKVFVIDGLKGWIDALVDSGDYVGYKPLEFLKSRFKKLSALSRTASKRFRDFEAFLQYAETHRIDIRDFGSVELHIYGDDFAANDYKAKMHTYNDKIDFYKSDTENRKQKVRALAKRRNISIERANAVIPVDQYTKDVKDKMRKKGISSAEAKELVPTKPTVLSANTMVDRMNAVSQLFSDIGTNFPPDEDGTTENLLDGVHLAYERVNPISYRLFIDDKKELKVETDEIIKIYQAILNAPIANKQYKRGIFILLRIIRETGARPANVVWLRWEDFPEAIGLDPRKISWSHAQGKATGGKGAPETSYISGHLAEDIDLYIADYDPDLKSYIAGAGIFPRHDTIVDAESGYRQIDHDVLSLHIRRLGRYTGLKPPILSKRFRKSFASLAYACAGESLVAELTGDQIKTVKEYYKDVGGRYVQVSGHVAGKFSPAEIARKVFDKEYPTTGIPNEYKKDVPR